MQKLKEIKLKAPEFALPKCILLEAHQNLLCYPEKIVWPYSSVATENKDRRK